ncbi:MAG TPA: serine/threonine-protein kinase, partial [Anaeromyxobacteraceae bacterium]|nr:serine/threonine-protein kinase [Anaeromyxobacteraceae bacterium]
MSEGAGEGSGRATGVEPGALSALLQEVAAAPEVRETEPATLPPGTLVGRFEIVRELGRGGFGVVYEARDRDLGRSVAVKVVRPGRVRDEEGKVAREAEAIARLGHPNLITLFEVGRSEHGPFLVFELLRGKTLDLRIEEGPLPVQEAVHVATEVARGLAHAHAEGVIHRDLKPPNVFVTNKGQVKILDFGMAHAFGRRRISGGTPAYMAPEQWEDEPEDERTDVFALGVMLYRMLTGEYPFPEGEGRWAAEGVAARKVDVPGAPGLADLVEKMLDRKPKERPRDGASVLEALEPIEARLRTRPADGKPPEHARRRKATFGDLLAELKRRHVFRVMVGYGVFAFAVLQVTEPIMHGAELPGWTLKAVLAALALGFPLAVVLAWIYDLTAQGVKRTPSAAVSGGRSFGRSRMLAPLAVSAALLLLAAVGAAGWHAWNGTKITPATHGTDARPMVAVADFSNETGEKELDSVSGLLITSLEQSRGLRVLTRSRMFDVARQLGKGDVPRIDESLAREVGRRVGARAVLLAAIRRTGDGYVVDLHAVDPSRDEYLFTVRERAAGKAAVFDLVDRVATVSRERLGPPGRAPDA